MKIFNLTTRPFFPETRKVSTHFIAEELAAAGHSVHVVTVGMSYLTLLKDKALFKQLTPDRKNRFVETQPGLNVSAYAPVLHPFSSARPLLNALNRPFFKLYGGIIPHYWKEPLAEADLVIFEPGSDLCFYDAIKRFNPNATVIYIQRDWLPSIGAAPILREVEQRMFETLDLVISPSSWILSSVPANCRTEIVPQAINKDLFDADVASPFPAGTRNALSVGNMLFDEGAVRAMAQAAPDVTYHVFGARFSEAVPANVIDYGERPFTELIPYMKHADFGIAPYKMTGDDVYLAETSLKFQQYAYCGLPVLAPDLIPDLRGNLIGYSRDDEQDWKGKIETALAMGRNEKFREGILSWGEVAGKIVTLAKSAKADQAGH